MNETKQKKVNLSKNIEPKITNNDDMNPVPMDLIQKRDENKDLSPIEYKIYHSTNESQDKK